MLSLTPLKGIPLIKQGDDLVQITLEGAKDSNIHIEDGDIFVFAQKIVSKAEGRKVQLSQVTPTEEAIILANKIEKDPRLIELILQESKEVLRTRPGLIIVEHRNGFVCANAGIDHSNVSGDEEYVLLLPENPDRSANMIRNGILAQTGKALGILIIDSHGRAWRLGTVGVTIGLAGIPGLVDMRGQPDLFGYELRVTQIGAADELAAAASLVMGQASEGTPIVHVKGFPYPARDAELKELIRPKDLDLFR